MRTDWGGFPNAIIAHTADTIKAHKNHTEAKSGSIDAALLLVDEYVTDGFFEQVYERIKSVDDVCVLPVHAEEQLGRNKIPMAFAMVIAQNLRLKVETNIVQANKVNRTGSDGVQRLLKRVFFDGEVSKDQNYLCG